MNVYGVFWREGKLKNLLYCRIKYLWIYLGAYSSHSLSFWLSCTLRMRANSTVLYSLMTGLSQSSIPQTQLGLNIPPKSSTNNSQPASQLLSILTSKSTIKFQIPSSETIIQKWNGLLVRQSNTQKNSMFQNNTAKLIRQLN